MSPIRTTVLALTAAVTFGAAMASTTTTASAWHKPHWKKWHPHHYGYWHRPYYRPYYAAPVVYSAPRPAPAPRVVSAPPQPPAQAQAPAQNPASCLSKAYTPEGQVVFSDNCTKESAMAPVPNVPQQQQQQQQSQQQSDELAPPQQNFAGKSFRKFNNTQPQAQSQQQ